MSLHIRTSGSGGESERRRVQGVGRSKALRSKIGPECRDSNEGEFIYAFRGGVARGGEGDGGGGGIVGDGGLSSGDCSCLFVRALLFLYLYVVCKHLFFPFLCLRVGGEKMLASDSACMFAN